MISVERKSREILFNLVTAVENAVLRAYTKGLGQGNKEIIDALASDAICGSLWVDKVVAWVVNGEGRKDNAPGIFRGERLGPNTINPNYTLAIVVDPIDGTGNAAAGKLNSISAIGAVLTSGVVDPFSLMAYLPADRCFKLAIGEHASSPREIDPEAPLAVILKTMAANAEKSVDQLHIVILDRDYNATTIQEIRQAGCNVRLIQDGDIAPVVAACMPEHPVDAYIGIGGTPELQIAVPAVVNLGGRIWARQWAKTEAEKEREGYNEDLYSIDELIAHGKDVRTIFVAAGLTDSDLCRGVDATPRYLITETKAIRSPSGTIRSFGAKHDRTKKQIFSYESGDHVGLPAH